MVDQFVQLGTGGVLVALVGLFVRNIVGNQSSDRKRYEDEISRRDAEIVRLAAERDAREAALRAEAAEWKQRYFDLLEEVRTGGS